MGSWGHLGRFVAVAAFVIVVVAISDSCQKSEDKPSEKATAVDNRFVDWKTFTFQNIKIVYPAGHPQENTFTSMAEAYLYLLKKVEDLLGAPPFTDTLTIYYYTGYGQGRELTGREYPYADSKAIHFWLPSFYGPPLMQYLLPRWASDPPRHNFLKHGLISMFDLSGQQYHASTIGYKNAGLFIPLEKLAVDTATNSNLERYQSAEAASFCAFMLGEFSAHSLRELYLSPLSFDASVRQICLVSVDTLEMRWLNYVKMNVPKDSVRN
jgi:hypothetical protein